MFNRLIRQEGVFLKKRLGNHRNVPAAGGQGRQIDPVVPEEIGNLALEGPLRLLAAF
jgi:hypothetical protein